MMVCVIFQDRKRMKKNMDRVLMTKCRVWKYTVYQLITSPVTQERL